MSLARFYLNHQFSRFLVFSGFAALANILVGYLLYELAGLKNGWQYGFSVAVSFLVGMGVSYTLNRSFTFDPSGRPVHREMLTFSIVSVGGLILTVVLATLLRASLVPAMMSSSSLSSLVPRGLTAEMTSHFIAVGLVAFYSFACHKLFSFGKGIRFYLSRSPDRSRSGEGIANKQ